MKKQRKPWIRTCLICSVALFLLAGLFYGYHYRMLDREFCGISDGYGDHYSEIFSFPAGDEPTELLEQVEAAFRTVGEGTELGLLSRYACTQGVRQDFDYECITYSVEDGTGYVWIAWWSRSYDTDGALLTSSGNEDQRNLTRWTLENGEIVDYMEYP